MAHDLYDLCDRLAALRNRLVDFQHEARILQSSDACRMAAELSELAELAKHVVHEVSRHRWNDLARREADELRIRALTMKAAKTGKVAFLNVERPFS